MSTNNTDTSESAASPALVACSLDSLFTITCGRCNKTSPALQWSERPISGELPAGEFQCPECDFAFRRQRATGNPFRKVDGEWKYQPIDLIPISPRL